MKIGQTRLIVALALGLFAWPLSAYPQQPAGIRVVGILSDQSPAAGAEMSLQPFVQALHDLGYIEGQNITFERRYAAERYEILPSLAAELVGLQPDVILAIGAPAAQAAKNATQAIPIVFVRTADPIGSGLVTSLARPGGNLTGLSILATETAAKRLEFLITAVPDARRVGVLWDPGLPNSGPELKELEHAARSLNRELVPVPVRSVDDFEAALQTMVDHRASALLLVPSPMIGEHTQQMVHLLTKARLPAIFFARGQVEAGGLMSYAQNSPADMYRRAAAYVDKILKGAKPADLPVEQPTKFELVINLNTAKALGLTLPYTLLGRADEVIE